MENETILEIKGISKAFPGVIALDQASFDLRKGEVHALIGENGAGKSTLMNVLLGSLQRDSGEIILNGEPIYFKNPHEALTHGIAMIHQEMSLVQSLNVAENIWLGHEEQFTQFGILNAKLRKEKTQNLLDEMNLDLDPDALVKSLSVAKMQMTELVRAVSINASIIIMDEPTSALTEREIDSLFANVRRLSETGVSIIFISHKLDEIFDICSRVTVMRDGATVGIRDCASLNKDDLVTMIVGREISNLFPKEDAEIKDVVLEVEGLTSIGVFENISFNVHSGEILGFCGLVGAGRTEVMNALFGIDKFDSGTVKVKGKSVSVKSPQHAIRSGLSMVTEDRLRLGAMHKLSVMANISIVKLEDFCNRLGVLRSKREVGLAQETVDKLSIRISGLDQLMGQLSGGNQQKVIIGRWLTIDPLVLILDEPTRGIDVGSKSEIHRLISKLAQTGVAIILVSSEMPEILGMCDRIVVMRDGKLAFECNREDASQELLIKHAFGV